MKTLATRLGATFQTLFVFALAYSSATRAAADGNPVADDGPVLIAQLPDKPKPETYDLHYKLSHGDVLRYDVTHRASIRTTIDDTTQAAQTKTDSVKVWKVSDVLPGGDIEFINVVERVHMVNQLPERDQVEYDSQRDKTPPPGFEDAARAVGVPLSVVRMTPRGKVVSRDAKLPGQNVEDDAPLALRLPEMPVAIGDTWDETFDVPVALEKGGGKSIQTRRHHKLASVAGGIATIAVTYQVLSPIDAYVECQLVQRLMEGEVRFDIEAGRVASQKLEVDKRILGFAGPTSSMQYIMRMEEKLLPAESKVTDKPAGKSNTAKGPTASPVRTRSADGSNSPQRTRNVRR